MSEQEQEYGKDPETLEIRVDPVREDIYVFVPSPDGGEPDVLIFDLNSAESMSEGLQAAVAIMKEFASLPGADLKSFQYTSKLSRNNRKKRPQ